MTPFNYEEKLSSCRRKEEDLLASLENSPKRKAFVHALRKLSKEKTDPLIERIKDGDYSFDLRTVEYVKWVDVRDEAGTDIAWSTLKSVRDRGWISSHAPPRSTYWRPRGGHSVLWRPPEYFAAEGMREYLRLLEAKDSAKLTEIFRGMGFPVRYAVGTGLYLPLESAQEILRILRRNGRLR